MVLLEVIHSMLEGVLGRKTFWRVSRKFYLLSRRDGSLDHTSNGEQQLLRALAAGAVARGRPIVAVDVGANHGEWIDMLFAAADAHSISEVSVHAFEPVPQFAAALRARAGALPAGRNLHVVNAALSKEAGRLDFVFTGNQGDHHIASSDFTLEGETIEVEVETLGSYAQRNCLSRIDLIKIDAEGFDPYVIQGAAALLALEAVDVVQFEYSVLFIRTRTYLYDVFAMVKDSNYRVGRLTRQGIEVFGAWHPDLERFYGTNYVLIHERAMAWANARHVSIDATNSYD